MHAASGFTLLEVIAALAVLSVAVYILVSLFLASLRVGEGARLSDTAAAIASEQMQSLIHAPASYAWPWPAGVASPAEDDAAADRDDRSADGAVRPLSDPDNDWHAVAAPAALPVLQSEHRREQTFHERFAWRAYARPLGDTEADALEVTVVVRWVHRGREQTFALTSGISVHALPTEDRTA